MSNPNDSSTENVTDVTTSEVADTPTLTPTLTPEALELIVQTSNRIKDEGNTLYRDGSYEEALEKYTEALTDLPSDHQLASIILSNRAACNINLEKWQLVIDDTTKALEIQPEYGKALCRRAIAHEKLDNLKECVEDYKKAQELDSKLVSQSMLETLEARLKVKQEKEMEEMMGQLKDIGNKFLGLFGLSTDNFKADKDENGSYKINFQK